MTNDPESESKTWWQTLPGLLTAAAGAITAITGLLLAFHQMGFFNHTPQTSGQVESRSASDTSLHVDGQDPATHPATAASASRLISLPGDTQVRSGENVYKLLSARLDPYSPGKTSLHLTVRMSNNGRYDTNFWAASFRLLVDGSLQAPTNDLDDVVSSNSIREGEVEFVIPSNIATAGLQMGDVGEGKPTIPLNFGTPSK
jgi:hypothetical protein